MSDEPKPTDAKTPKSSKNLIIAIAVAIGITGICVWAYATNQSESPRVMVGELDGVCRQIKVPVVYAVQDIPEGNTITPEALEEKEILENKVPKGALRSVSMACNRKAKYGLTQGQIVREQDVGGKVVMVVRTTIKIPKGNKFSKAALKLEEVKVGGAPKAVIGKIEDVVGQVAKRDIAADQLVFAEYFVSKDATTKKAKH